MKMTQLNSFSVKGGANLIGGGDVSADQLHQIRNSGLPVYCADAGLLIALDAGLEIAGVIGDLDTVGSAAIEGVPIAHIEDQNTTDFDKSLSLIESQYILCYGFLGGRLDHSLASISSLAKSNTTAFLMNELDFTVVCPPDLALKLPVGSRVSLYPVVPTKARSKGLAYNVDGVDLSPIGMISTSNMTSSPKVQVWIDSGLAVIVIQNNNLVSVLEQWPFEQD